MLGPVSSAARLALSTPEGEPLPSDSLIALHPYVEHCLLEKKKPVLHLKPHTSIAPSRAYSSTVSHQPVHTQSSLLTDPDSVLASSMSASAAMSPLKPHQLLSPREADPSSPRSAPAIEDFDSALQSTLYSSISPPSAASADYQSSIDLSSSRLIISSKVLFSSTSGDEF